MDEGTGPLKSGEPVPTYSGSDQTTLVADLNTKHCLRRSLVRLKPEDFQC